MKTAVITGSSRGLGKAIAAAVLDRGINVVVSGSDPGACQSTMESLGEGRDGAQALAVACDVTSKSDLQNLAEQAQQAFSRIDYWINNAGLALSGSPLLELEEAEFRRMLDINLVGALLGSQVAINAMAARGGALYNVLGAGTDGNPVPGMGGYATTKSALTFMTRSLAMEQEGSSVIVGGISPGLIMTEGFWREFAKVPPGERAERARVVNIIGDHPETSGNWVADVLQQNRENGHIFTWLTPDKIAERQQMNPPRDILSRYGSLADL